MPEAEQFGFALCRYKHGRKCVLAKIVRAEPTGEIVIAMPVRNRRFSAPSLPATAFQLARRLGATAWIVRLDHRGQAYRIGLDEALALAGVGDDGELYVPLSCFRPIGWVDWPFVRREVLI